LADAALIREDAQVVGLRQGDGNAGRQNDAERARRKE
jgi:hypothetical protein